MTVLQLEYFRAYATAQATMWPLNLPFFSLANYIEALFWIIVAGGFAIAAIRRSGPLRHRCWTGAAAFLLFGFSDVVEVQTGAWYDPWWLLVWNGLCLAVILWLLIIYVRQRRLQEQGRLKPPLR